MHAKSQEGRVARNGVREIVEPRVLFGWKAAIEREKKIDNKNDSETIIVET